MFFITNSKPIKVSATGQKKFLKSLGIETYDSIQCNIEWSNENNSYFNQTILCSWVESNKASAISKQDFKLICINGRIDLEQKERGVRYLTDNSSTEDMNPDFCRVYSKDDFKTFEGYGIDSIENFLKVIENNNLKDFRLCTFKQASISTAVIEAANVSLENNSDWIYIDKLIK